MVNTNKYGLIKELIKFATFYYYYVLNYLTKPFAAYLMMDYYIRVHSRYENFIAYGSRILDNIVQLRVKFNEDIIYPLSLSTFNRRKRKILSITRHAYLISLKEEKLLPFTECKIKPVTLDTLLQIEYDPNVVYVLSGYDVSKIVEFYLDAFKTYESYTAKEKQYRLLSYVN